MYPANHYMDPCHSHYRSHTPYPYYPPPRWEIPPGHPRAIDSSYRPASCGPWPYNAGMHHPHPSEYHCCCNQTYPPDYYSFRPPVSQELPPPHLYYHGPFPQHSNACPSYFVLPHPYPVDQTPYGYDKIKSHCCGCPNHVCHGAEKSNVKIEEERPDVKLDNEHKNADSGSIIRHPNNQYPFIWLPSGNMEGKENGKHYELSPQLLNRWAPGSSKRTGDMEQQEQDNQEKQFQWPIVWMPAGYDELKQKDKETEEIPKAPNISEEAPQSPKIKIIPLSWFENGHHDQKPAARDGSGDHNDRSAVKNQPLVTDHQDGMTLEGSPKTTPALPKRVNDERKPVRETYKTIPVVPEKETDEKKAGTCRNIPVMKESDERKTVSETKEAKDRNAGKIEENGEIKHTESSTAKHSKLPPVCLRVDPLPRKKSGNGSSRSPSPPAKKDGDKAKKDVEAQGQNVEPKQSAMRGITVSEVKEKIPDGMEREMSFTNETVQDASAEHSREEEAPTSIYDQKVQPGSTAQETAGAMQVQENAGAGRLRRCDKRTNRDETVVESETARDYAQTRRANLSGSDAAVRIQSAYRGYDVRRWQPLDKLRKIRDVHEHMQGVRKQLQCLENSCKKPTEKEQVAISETIMNLLLKLDTIQGLHPSVREARKSIARELICLQEKLDTLCKQPTGEHNHRNSAGERAENIIPTAAPGITTEASDRENEVVGLVKAKEPALVESMDLCDPVPSLDPLEESQDTDASEQKNKKEELCTTNMEVAPEEVPSSMDMMSDAALPEHQRDNKELQIEETNAVSEEQVTEEEKPAAEGERQEVPLATSTESLQEAGSSGDPSGLKQCPVSTEKNLDASTEDINAGAAATSAESGMTTEKDGSVDGQVHGTAALESLELKHDVSSAEDQQNRMGSGILHSEDLPVPLKDVEQHDLTPANDLVMSKTEDQQGEAMDIYMQVQAVDTMQDSDKGPDGTPESETDIQESHPNLTEEADYTGGRTVFPELDSSELSHDCGIPIHERPETNGPSEGQNEVQKENGCSDRSGADVVVCETDECTETLKETALVDKEGASSAEDSDPWVSQTDKCKEREKDGTATGANPAKGEANTPKGGVAVQTYNKASEEASSGYTAPGDLKDSDERKLAEENQKLKELLQKLLASGNDQMGFITDLSEKVKALERRLARKKRPKVRVHRPSKHATAKVH